MTGIRQDAFAEAHPIVVEEEKAVADRGRYLHPVEHGQPAAMGDRHARRRAGGCGGAERAIARAIAGGEGGAIVASHLELWCKALPLAT